MRLIQFTCTNFNRSLNRTEIKFQRDCLKTEGENQRMDYRKPVAHFFLGFLFVSIFISGVSSILCIFEDQLLTPEGECVDCPFCPAGQGMDLEKEVLRNSDGDPLECRACEPCGSGFYNNPKDTQYACIPCPEPCFKKNRKEYIPCGGSTIGHCGACINSDFEDPENNHDAPCRRKNESRTTLLPFKQVTDGSRPSTADPRRTKRRHDEHRDRAAGLSIEWICLIFSVLLLTGIVVVVYFRRRIVQMCCQTDPELAKEVSSKTTMISSTGTTISSLIDSRNNVKSSLSSDTDLEVDALLLSGKGDDIPLPHRARRELMHSYGMPSSGPECIHGVQPRQYPKFLLTPNDKYIVYTSRQIFEEGKINAMFREMGLSEQIIYSEHDLYVREKQQYNDMVIHYLQKWIEKAGRSATFDALCKALDKHGFPDVSDILLKMYHGHDKLG